MLETWYYQAESSTRMNLLYQPRLLLKHIVRLQSILPINWTQNMQLILWFMLLPEQIASGDHY